MFFLTHHPHLSHFLEENVTVLHADLIIARRLLPEVLAQFSTVHALAMHNTVAVLFIETVVLLPVNHSIVGHSLDLELSQLIRKHYSALLEIGL